MDAPKCKICGKREFNHSCSGAVGLSNLPADTEAGAKKFEYDLLDISPADAENCPVCGASLKAKERRREYMRNYMRNRRTK